MMEISEGSIAVDQGAVRFREARSDYYDGIAYRHWRERRIELPELRGFLEDQSEKQVLLWEALQRIRHMRRDLDAVTIAEFVNYVCLYVFHREHGHHKPYEESLAEKGFNIENLFYDKERE